MKHNKLESDPRVKNRAMGWLQLAASYLVMLLLVGIQVGLIVFPGFLSLNKVVQVVVIMGYWAIVATGFGLVTNYQIKENYDKPLRKLSGAAKKVAEGDFSIYIEPQHAADRYDYIDVMFLDFNRMVQELGSIETLKNDFVSNVSHEIKTPLAVIRNYTAELAKGSLPQDIQEDYMKTVVKATDHLSALVSNILRLNKLENQEILPPAEAYNLCRQLSDCLLGYESLLNEKNINLTVTMDDRALIVAEQSMLEIVWNNLLSNALKFTEPGGEIKVSQFSDSDTITVTIADNGCGMDEKTMKHVFDKFFQADSSHSGEGNGLGLALAYRIVEKMRGTITVVSKLGSGSTFTVTIPLRNKGGSR